MHFFLRWKRSSNFSNISRIMSSKNSTRLAPSVTESRGLWTGNFLAPKLLQCLNLMFCYCWKLAGSVFYVDEAGKIKRPFVVDGPVRKLLYYDEKNVLVTVTENLMLTLHNVTNDGTTSEALKVRADWSSCISPPKAGSFVTEKAC